MMRNNIRGSVLLVAGIAILCSAMLHGFFNIPHLREDLLELGVRPTLVAAVTIVLSFSVVAMFAFAGLVLNSAAKSFGGGDLQLAPLWLIAASYVVFGIAAFVLVSRSPHLLGYAGFGVLVALGAAMRPTRVGNGIRGAA